MHLKTFCGKWRLLVGFGGVEVLARVRRLWRFWFEYGGCGGIKGDLEATLRLAMSNEATVEQHLN